MTTKGVLGQSPLREDHEFSHQATSCIGLHRMLQLHRILLEQNSAGWDAVHDMFGETKAAGCANRSTAMGLAHPGRLSGRGTHRHG